jgi:hypothetical protein
MATQILPNFKQGIPQGSSMTNARIRQLNALEFVWDPLEDLWEKRYEELVEYYKEHGHSIVPTQSRTHQQLSSWVASQRQI